GVPADNVVAGSLEVAADGPVTASITFSGVLDLGDGAVDTLGQEHFALVRHAATGELMWSTSIVSETVGGIKSEIEHVAAAIDCAGNVIVGGGFTGTIVVEDLSLTAVPGTNALPDVIAPTEDMFLIKVGPDGARHWAQRFGDGQGQ